MQLLQDINVVSFLVINDQANKITHATRNLYCSIQALQAIFNALLASPASDDLSREIPDDLFHLCKILGNTAEISFGELEAVLPDAEDAEDEDNGAKLNAVGIGKGSKAS